MDFQEKVFETGRDFDQSPLITIVHLTLDADGGETERWTLCVNVYSNVIRYGV